MPKRLQSSTVLVTGGAARIGKAVCEAFADAGYSVVVHYRSSATEAKQLADSLRAAGCTAWTVKGRLDTESGCRKVMADAWKVSGGISVLVNNASIYDVAEAADTDWSLLCRTFNTNLFGPACLSRQFMKLVTRRKSMKGCIVNLLDSRITGTDSGSAAYTLSKKALADYTVMAAGEFAPRIRVNGVAPGAALPPKGRGTGVKRESLRSNPLQRIAGPKDVASAALYLAEADSVTGQIVFVDSGKHLES